MSMLQTYILAGDEKSEHGHVADVVGQVVGLVQDGVQVSAGDIQASGGDHGAGKS